MASQPSRSRYTINFLAQLLLGYVETIAGVIDTIAGIFGADLGGADAIRSPRQDIERGLLEGVDEVTAGVTVAPAGTTLTALDAEQEDQQKGESGPGPWMATRMPLVRRSAGSFSAQG